MTRIVAAMFVCLSATLVHAQQRNAPVESGGFALPPSTTPAKSKPTKSVEVTQKFLVILETGTHDKRSPIQSSPFESAQFIQSAANKPSSFSTTTTADSVRVICDDLEFSANMKDGKRAYSFSSQKVVTIVVETSGQDMTIGGTECKFADGVLEIKDAKIRIGQMEMTAAEFKLKLDVQKVSVQKQDIHTFNSPKGKPQPMPVPNLGKVGSPNLPSTTFPAY